MNTMVKKIEERLRKVPIGFWVFGAILIVGIFLRTYEFRDWMTFNPDQARDALLVQDMIDGKQWPLMGPQAGNTFFKLGPIFYYFEYVAAWLFGPSADKMAYPDLLFSIATIILAYFFFRKFFEEKIALVVTFLLSISFFVVTYSRFAFNPNSIPFFTLLFFFALLAIIDNAPKEKLGWAVVLGVAMGIGFQLHTILFISMPLLALLVLGYLFIQKHFIWKSILITLFFFTIMNATQILSEMRNNGTNFHSFFKGVGSSTESLGRNYLEDLSNDVICHIQGITYIASSLGSGDKCNLTGLVSRIEENGIKSNIERIAIAIFGSVFTIGGFILLYYFTKNESDQKRKRAAVLIGVYSLITFAVLFPVSSNVSMRYFIVIEFMPFLLTGFWIRYLLKIIYNNRFTTFCIGFFVIIFAAFNILTIKNSVEAFNNKTAGTSSVAVFGEVELMSQYLLENSNGSPTIYLSGESNYLSRYAIPLEYFIKQKGKALKKVYDPETIEEDDAFFYITKKTSKKIFSSEVIKGFASEKAVVFGNVTIITLKRNP